MNKKQAMNKKMNRLWLKEANKISFVKTAQLKKKTESFWFSPKQFLFWVAFFAGQAFAFSPWVWIPAWIQSDPETKKIDMLFFLQGPIPYI